MARAIDVTHDGRYFSSSSTFLCAVICSTSASISPVAAPNVPTSGSIPAELGQLGSLRALTLHGNKLKLFGEALVYW